MNVSSTRAARRRPVLVTLGALLLMAGVVAAGMPADASEGKTKGRKWNPPSTTSTTSTSTTSTTSTTLPQAPPSSVAPSGEPMPVGDLPGWRQIFADDFTKDVPLGSFPSAVSDRWGAYQDGWPDTTHHGTYMPSKVLSVSGGLLNFHIHTEGGVHMVSAPYPRINGANSPGFGQLYGRYAVRFRADPLHLYKTAWLLWPDSETWPRDGEIDFPEGDLDGTISAFMHRQGATSGGDQDYYVTNATYPTWHTAVIEWRASSLTFILDGRVIGTSTDRIPNTPMHWVLQTETALTAASPADSTAGNVQVDWVAVYSPA